MKNIGSVRLGVFFWALLATGGAQAAKVTLENLPFYGSTREYLVVMPDDYQPVTDRPLGYPAIVTLHPEGFLAEDYLNATALLEHVDNNKLILILPQGASGVWNAEGCCSADTFSDQPGRTYGSEFIKKTLSEGVADVEFLDNALTDVMARFNINPDYLFMIGEGNGGALAFRVYCESRLPFKGFGISGGANFQPKACWKANPSALFSVHSLDDDRFPYTGKTAYSNRSVENSALDPVMTRYWVPSVQASLKSIQEINGCQGYLESESTAYYEFTFSCSKAPLRHRAYHNAGRNLIDSSKHVNARCLTADMLGFFQQATGNAQTLRCDPETNQIEGESVMLFPELESPENECCDSRLNLREWLRLHQATPHREWDCNEGEGHKCFGIFQPIRKLRRVFNQ